MEGFRACCQQHKQAAFVGHHGSPPNGYCAEPRTLTQHWVYRRTFPRHWVCGRTLPQHWVCWRTFPRHWGCGRTLPQHWGCGRTLPQHWVGADPPTFKPFLSRSFVVRSTCWVGISVREVIRCRCFTRRRFDISQFFQVALSRVLDGIRIRRGVTPQKVAHYYP